MTPLAALSTHRRWPLAALVALLLVLALQPLLAQASFEGVASCAGSTCHGRSEGNGTVVRQDELLRWQEPSSPAGAHSRAYAVLSGRRGQQIVASLGLNDEGRARACLGCHATNAPPALRGQRFQLNEGVGCESCHGASSVWLPTHRTVPATHDTNVAQGMIDLLKPQVRAQKCLGCHLGSDEPGQFVNHRMMAAGHPRLSFELDLFSALQQHHTEGLSYSKRKGRTDSVQLWAVGQAEAIRRSLDLFANPRFGSEGIFPEFTFYDCHSCHREIDDKGERTRTFEVNPGRPIALGMPPYQDENIIMLSAVAKALAPEKAARFDAASRSFHAAMGSGRSAAIAAGARLDSAASELSNELAGKRYGGDAAFTVIGKISSQAIAARFTDYEGSVQAVMAVDTLLNALVRERRITVGAAAGIRVQVNRAYAAVGSPRSYDPPTFRAALGQAARSIGALK